MRFGKLTSGRDFRESQLLLIVSDSSNSCLCCTGNFSLFKPLIYRLFNDAGRRSPGNDMAVEQFFKLNDCRQVGWMLVMASIMNSATGLPSILNSFTKRGIS
ncbi:hypothetical protein V8G54_009411 [Vigna mungo]|uniref:Uncharacterized protein n=1 Tax=Vigna mungo TaxID=3915 RepID=A0AAQ3S5G2_VIGMU